MAIAPRTHHAEAWHTPKGRAIREVIFGMNDGLVTTIGFLAGVTISISEMRFVLLAGIAEIVAGAAIRVPQYGLRSLCPCYFSLWLE